MIDSDGDKNLQNFNDNQLLLIITISKFKFNLPSWHSNLKVGGNIVVVVEIIDRLS